jgi:Holliday junction resolvasome RuvABC DNA-binding subunit
LSEVHQALTGLGFKEREARWMVGEVRPHVGAMKIEDAIRCALRVWQERGRAMNA